MSWRPALSSVKAMYSKTLSKKKTKSTLAENSDPNPKLETEMKNKEVASI